jgi:hypothetical protein
LNFDILHVKMADKLDTILNKYFRVWSASRPLTPNYSGPCVTLGPDGGDVLSFTENGFSDCNGSKHIIDLSRLYDDIKDASASIKNKDMTLVTIAVNKQEMASSSSSDDDNDLNCTLEKYEIKRTSRPSSDAEEEIKEDVISDNVEAHAALDDDLDGHMRDHCRRTAILCSEQEKQIDDLKKTCLFLIEQHSKLKNILDKFDK